MLEANIWKLKQDLEAIRAAAQVPYRLMSRYEIAAETVTLTPQQKQAALGTLTAQMQAVETALETARDTFTSETVIERPTETAP